MNEMLAALDRKYGFQEGTMQALIRQESRGDVSAVSPAGARGLCQFMPGTRAEMMAKYAIDPWSKNPEIAAEAGAIYLSEQLRKYGNLPQALAAYNAGPGRVDQAIREGGTNWFSHLPNETKKYVPSIMARANLDDRIAFTDRMRTGGEAISPDEMAVEEQIRRQMLRNLGMSEEMVAAIPAEQLNGALFIALVFALASHVANTRQPTMVPPQGELGSEPMAGLPAHLVATQQPSASRGAVIS